MFMIKCSIKYLNSDIRGRGDGINIELTLCKSYIGHWNMQTLLAIWRIKCLLIAYSFLLSYIYYHLGSLVVCSLVEHCMTVFYTGEPVAVVGVCNRRNLRSATPVEVCLNYPWIAARYGQVSVGALSSTFSPSAHTDQIVEFILIISKELFYLLLYFVSVVYNS